MRGPIRDRWISVRLEIKYSNKLNSALHAGPYIPIRRYYPIGCLPMFGNNNRPYSQYKNKYNNCTDDVAFGTIRFYLKKLK